MCQDIKMLDEIFYILILVKTCLKILVKNSLNCTPTRATITVCKLELNKPDLVKEFQSTEIIFKKLWNTK